MIVYYLFQLCLICTPKYVAPPAGKQFQVLLFSSSINSLVLQVVLRKLLPRGQTFATAVLSVWLMHYISILLQKYLIPPYTFLPISSPHCEHSFQQCVLEWLSRVSKAIMTFSLEHNKTIMFEVFFCIPAIISSSWKAEWISMQ